MRRSMVLVVAACAAMTAAPASAQGPVEGTTSMVEYLGFGGEQCPEVAWVGTLEVSDSGDLDGTYGFTLYHTAFGEDTNSVFVDGWWRWSEYFAVRDGLYELDEEGLLVDCEPGELLLQGFDTGVGNTQVNRFWDTGYAAQASGPFEGMAGAKVDQIGTFTVFNDELSNPDGSPYPTAFEAKILIE